MKPYVFGRTTKRQGYRPNPFDAPAPIERYDQTTYQLLEGIWATFKPSKCDHVIYAMLLMKQNHGEGDVNKIQNAKSS